MIGDSEGQTLEPETREALSARKILAGELPIPTGKRWQPLRAGLMNLFLFEDERFPFAGGRLLLRGSNGTGKSRVLAMTLPLLLDGSLKATRVEPDRDATRQVAWNVLGDDQHSATGYSWLEFGRLDEEGEHFVTIGMGIRAIRDGSMKSWFFVTPRRVDESLSLQSIDGVPLTERALEETLGSPGQVIKTAAEYRRIVDETLFRLAERYDPLIDLLLQLRQPQLAKKLDIEQLEAALRVSLPPLKQSLLDDAAEAFRELDEYRTSLAAAQELLRAIEGFMRPYREHVRRGVLRSIKQLTTTNSRFETEQRNLRELVDLLEQDRQQRDRLLERKQSLRVAIETHRAAIEELQQSPEMLSAARLDERRQAVEKLDLQAATAERELERIVQQQQLARTQWEANREAVQKSTDAVIRVSEEARKLAAPEALQNLHQTTLHSLFVHDPPPEDRFDAYQKAETVLQERADAYQRSAAHLIQLNDKIDAAHRHYDEAIWELERAEANLRDRTDRLQGTRQQRSEIVAAVWQQILQWYESASFLHDDLPTIARWSDQWYAWAEQGLTESDDRSADPSLMHLQSAQSKALRRLADQRSRLRAELDALDAHQAALTDQQRRLESGEPIRPPVPMGRDLTHRDRLPGAPLWQLIDFEPAVPESERAGWEAALEDAGLLDAWVTPEGKLLSSDDPETEILDVQLRTSALQPLPDECRLSRVVTPDAGELSAAGIEPPTLQQLLAVIGVGTDAGPTWVAADGRWRNGPLQGRWAKPVPQYIGRETRERYQNARLQEIAAELESLVTQRRQVTEALERLDEDQQRVESLVESFPSREPLVAATLAVESAEHDVDVATDDREHCRDTERQRRADEERLVEQRDTDAADAGLSGWADRAGELSNRIETYRQRLQTLEARIDTLRGAFSAADQSKQTLDNLIDQTSSAEDRTQQLQAELAAERKRVTELEATVGRDAEAIMERLDATRQELKRDEDAAEANGEEVLSVQQSLAVTDNKIQQSELDSERYDAERREAADWLSSLQSHGLLRSADEELEPPELPWSMTQALKVARQMDASLGEIRIDDEAWHRSQTKIHEAQNELQQTIFSQDGYSIAADHLRDGLQKVTLTLEGEPQSPPDAIRRLRADIESRQQILDEREQDTLERYLLGEVAEGLRVGMQNADELIQMMTTEVSKRPMKTGMQMRFKWQRADDGPAGLAEACQVLATSSATWSAEEREQIKRFLQQSIRLQRESEQTESWHDHLATALDYRLWHRIVIERRSGPDAAWQRLTRRTYGTGSGGEKAISLTLPQLAAAAAYYRSADELAPRFILLDEAFAGVSPDMREGCMDLIDAFQLDVVMTSESEWGMYPGVKQLAICQLDRFADIDAVVNRVFIWNGSELRTVASAEDAAEALEQPLFDR